MTIDRAPRMLRSNYAFGRPVTQQRDVRRERAADQRERLAPVRVRVTPRLCVLWLATFAIDGCTSSELWVTPRLEMSLQGIDLPIRHFNARINGPFLEVNVRAARRDDEYQSNFDLEIKTAVEVCRALSQSRATFEGQWQNLVLEVENQYGPMRWHTHGGSLTVRVPRDILQSLGERTKAQSECSANWSVQYGWKRGPGGRILEWKFGDRNPPSLRTPGA